MKQEGGKKLTAMQKYVTEGCGTEPPFLNEYWNNRKEGIYVDIKSGVPLFASVNKFDSGTGWPSFTKPVNKEELIELEDNTLGMRRTEVKARSSGSHLGHVFDDGPVTEGGLRYCINSAALRFIASENMEAEGYGEFLDLFSQSEAAALAGGCFWGMEELFTKLEGVMETKVGYTGGSTENPGYEDVSTGKTGHAEAVLIKFKPRILSYTNLLKFFFQIHDPTTKNKQGNDVGSQYRSAIFYMNEKQKNEALEVMESAEKSGIFGAPIVTELTPFQKFFEAEKYHQKYLEKNPGGYTCHFIRREWKF